MRHKFLLITILFITACAGTPDPYALDAEATDAEITERLSGCEHIYLRNSQIVAVTAFSNNTSYQEGDYKASSSQSGTVISPIQIGRYSNSSDVEKYLSPQLGEYAQNVVETMLVDMGGPTVVSRSKIEAVLQEQQFQMTLADPSTIVDFGMLMGAQYIVTGSVDNIALKYTSSVDGDFGASSTLGAILSLGSMVYNAAASGWDVSVRVTVNVIDVSTGKIIGTHVNEGKASIGDIPTLTIDQVIAGAKLAMNKNIDKTLAFLNQQFELRVYINELRGGKKVARVNAGSNHGLKPGDKLQLINVVSHSDFLTGSSSCVLNPSDITLTITEYITEDSAWAVINTSDKKKLSKIKIGSIAKRVSVKR